MTPLPLTPCERLAERGASRGAATTPSPLDSALAFGERFARGERGRRGAAVAVVAVILASALGLTGCGTIIHGRVFVDRDRDGVRDPDEPGVADVRVFFESSSRARTTADGEFDLVTTAPYGIAWAWTPDGFRPGPSYAHARDPDGDTAVDIPLVAFTPPPATAPWTFAVASDSHVVVPSPDDRWDGGDLRTALTQLVAPAPTAPAFYTILGDITQGGMQAQVDAVEAARSSIATPFVPVAGNHDFYDEVPTWRLTYGPEAYGFDIGSLRVLVWNGFVDDSIQLALVHLALDGEDPTATIVGFGHASPRDVVARDMAALGVDYLFTGHWHANRRVDRFGLVEWGTESITMGGLDHGPAGYRVVTVDGHTLTTESRRTLLAPVLALAAPATCVPPGPVDVIAIAALDAGAPAVTAAWSDAPAGSTPTPLAPRGGWAYAGALDPMHRAARSLTLTAVAPSGARRTTALDLVACTAGTPPAPRAGAWPQIQGGPEHTGASPTTAVDLAPVWTATVGGPVIAGAPVIAGDTVYVTVTDLGDGDRGGVVALALASGRERWRFATARPARAAAAVDRGTVVVSDSGGTVYALDATTGRERWRKDLAAGTDSWSWHLWQPPTIVDGAVIIGTQPRFAALDLATGASRWLTELERPAAWLGATAAAAIAGDRVVMLAGRADGLWSGDRATGATTVAVASEDYVGIAGAPVVTPERTFVANTYGDVLAIDPASLGEWWKTPTVAATHAWSDAIVGNLATAGERVFAPTQTGELVALDAVTGALLWRAPVGVPGPLTVAAYASDGAGTPASPVVTGALVWIGGVDGVLRGFDAATGRELEAHPLGSPIFAPIAPAGAAVVVATFGGTVHLLAPPTRSPPAFPWAVFPLGLIAIAAIAALSAARARRS